MSWQDSLYAKFPLPLQNLSVTLYGAYWHWLRFGGDYKRFAEEYRQREKYTLPQWEEYQQQKLTSLLRLAAQSVPYYRSTWNKQQKLAAMEGHLSALPILEKDPLRINPLAFVREDKRGAHLWNFATSGSTGTPISTYWNASEVRLSLAAREVRSANWAGVSYKLPRATFSGRMVEPDPQSKGPYYRFNAIEKQVYFSPFHLRPDTAKYYVDALKQHKIQWLTGYAVSYFLLAKFILESGLEIPPLKAIITTSEKLTSEMRSVMEEAYHCRIYEEYSTVENSLFASECGHGSLHVSPDVGIVEILRPDGSACLPGEPGEVVTTGLMKTSQPFIRFRLGDMAAWDEPPCPCGLSMPVIKEVIGRIEDVVIGPDGRQMVRFHGIFTNQPHVIEGQIIQESLTAITVKIVPTLQFTSEDVQNITQRIHQRLGPQVNVKVETVHAIPRLPSGKFQAVISKVTR